MDTEVRDLKMFFGVGAGLVILGVLIFLSGVAHLMVPCLIGTGVVVMIWAGLRVWRRSP